MSKYRPSRYGYTCLAGAALSIATLAGMAGYNRSHPRSPTPQEQELEILIQKPEVQKYLSLKKEVKSNTSFRPQDAVYLIAGGLGVAFSMAGVFGPSTKPRE